MSKIKIKKVPKEFNEKDIEIGTQLICKIDLILDDIAYFEGRGNMYSTLKQKASLFRAELERPIARFFKLLEEKKTSGDEYDEKYVKEYYEKVERLREKIKLI